MRLDIFADVICPWCYIGKRRLDRALTLRPQRDLILHWRSFELNPKMPPEGIARDRYLAMKFGSTERALSILDMLTELGRREGMAFAFERIQRTPNTGKAHRLLSAAWLCNRQGELLEALFAAYFLAGEDIGDPDCLRTIAKAAGLPSDAINRALIGAPTGDDRSSIDDETSDRQAIAGVPFFVFNNRFTLSGAQEVEALIDLFDLAREEDRMRSETMRAAAS